MISIYCLCGNKGGTASLRPFCDEGSFFIQLTMHSAQCTIEDETLSEFLKFIKDYVKSLSYKYWNKKFNEQWIMHNSQWRNKLKEKVQETKYKILTFTFPRRDLKQLGEIRNARVFPYIIMIQFPKEIVLSLWIVYCELCIEKSWRNENVRN